MSHSKLSQSKQLQRLVKIAQLAITRQQRNVRQINNSINEKNNLLDNLETYKNSYFSESNVGGSAGGSTGQSQLDRLDNTHLYKNFQAFVQNLETMVIDARQEIKQMDEIKQVELKKLQALEVRGKIYQKLLSKNEQKQQLILSRQEQGLLDDFNQSRYAYRKSH